MAFHAPPRPKKNFSPSLYRCAFGIHFENGWNAELTPIAFAKKKSKPAGPPQHQQMYDKGTKSWCWVPSVQVSSPPKSRHQMSARFFARRPGPFSDASESEKTEQHYTAECSYALNFASSRFGVSASVKNFDVYNPVFDFSFQTNPLSAAAKLEYRGTDPTMFAGQNFMLNLQ
eukprot:gnl/Spiro4/24190_TR12005_c0_g1_i1.p1 gnl/Spiro4/24190_TR12005_c0_g1~~gnl/Spiro4/24190_TR12005_c0_g1_i1.p1  ORF type:complete len:173 (+),score=5.42 gnl/Spiro4/24190_TR12005_c0_g1_i1:68-586(+)